MKGTKRLAISDSPPDTSDTSLRSKRVLMPDSSILDSTRPEPTRPQQLDMKRAESSRQHVRALNTLFASWVQAQVKNHPDELWEDGVRDYIAHASNIMENFDDVVSWLKANSAKGGPPAESLTSEKKLLPETNHAAENKSLNEKPGLTLPSTSMSFTNSWSFSAPSSNQSSGGVLSNSQSTGLLSNSQSIGLFSNSQSTGLFSNSQSTGLFSNSQTMGLPSSSHGGGLFSKGAGFFTSSQSSGTFPISQSSGLFSNSQPSVTFSSNQSTGPFSSSQTPIFSGGESMIFASRNTTDEADEENELPQPGSPSLKKAEEKGVVLVHEVKCKLYIKSTDPADKDAWKDKGTGQLSIKCKEGVSKGTKESKPTIIVRNDAGKVLLNALLYPGIKTNAQKNSLVAIFHISADDSGDNDNVVARTFLIRLRTEEDRTKLAAAIQDYAPTS